MQAIVTDETTGGQSQQHFDLGGSELVATPVYKGVAVTAPAISPMAPLSKPAPFNEADLTNSVSIQAKANREARIARPTATLADSMLSALKTTDTAGLIKRAFRPKFTGPKINKAEYLEELGIYLDEDEYGHFNDLGDTLAGANYAIGEIKAKRKAYELMGDHPAVAGVVSLLGDAWMGVPPTFKIARMTNTAQRISNGIQAGAIAGGVTYFKEGPKSDGEIALNILANSTAAALFINPVTSKLEARVPEQPSAASHKILKDIADQRTDVEGVAKTLQPGATDRTAMLDDMDAAYVADNKKRGLGERIAWNQHKTMSGYGVGGEEAANKIFSNARNPKNVAMEDHREPILGDLNHERFKVVDGVLAYMAAKGFDTLAMANPFKVKGAMQAQSEIEDMIAREARRRETAHRRGIDYRSDAVDPAISKIVDDMALFHNRGLSELKSAGVLGADTLESYPGFLSRRHSSFQYESALQKLKAVGVESGKARTALVELVERSLRSANQSWDDIVSKEVAQAIVTRTLNRGEFSDSVLNGALDNAKLAQIREVLEEGGTAAKTVEHVLNRLKLNVDDAGKADFLRHRVDLDYDTALELNGVRITMHDLLDNRVLDTLDRYGQGVSTEAAFARVGIRSQSDIDAMRTRLIETTPIEKRAKAVELFDNAIAYFKGLPSGQRMANEMRLAQQYTRSISMSGAGFWQIGDFANIWSHFGMVEAVKHARREIPLFGRLLDDVGTDTELARSLTNVLSDYSKSSLRMQPYVRRLEDGWDLDTGSTAQLAGQGIGQLVSRVNGLKYVHSKQANLASNLVVERIRKAVSGDRKALDALDAYGLKPHVVEKVGKEIRAKGMDVDSWSNEVWAAVRPSLHIMMDDLVLRARAGDLPGFMMYDNLGKFLTMYRSFTFAANSRLLAGRLERDGGAAVGMMLMYQMPLTYLAVAAQSSLYGRDETTEQIAAKSLGMLGGLGLLAEPMNWALGNSSEFGTPGTIPVDRMIKFAQDPTLTNTMNITPLAAANPLWKAIAERNKE